MAGRAKKPETTVPKVAIQQWWHQTGTQYEYQLSEWDPDTATVVQAILELLDDGLTVVLRPGSGGRAIGLAIWKGDDRQPAKWFGDQDEMNEYCTNIVKLALARRKKEPEGS